jgi:transcriptional regulator with XRE-family HTH domain
MCWRRPLAEAAGVAVTLAERIDELVAQHGSLRAVARVTEIDAGYLSRLRAGEKVNPEKDKLRRLGLRRVVTFERLKPPNGRIEPQAR